MLWQISACFLNVYQEASTTNPVVSMAGEVPSCQGVGYNSDSTKHKHITLAENIRHIHISRLPVVTRGTCKCPDTLRYTKRVESRYCHLTHTCLCKFEDTIYAQFGLASRSTPRQLLGLTHVQPSVELRGIEHISYRNVTPCFPICSVIQCKFIT